VHRVSRLLAVHAIIQPVQYISWRKHAASDSACQVRSALALAWANQHLGHKFGRREAEIDEVLGPQRAALFKPHYRVKVT